MATERRPFFSNAFIARAGRWGLFAWSLIGILILAVGIFRYVLYPIRVVFPPLLVAVIIVYMLGPLVALSAPILAQFTQRVIKTDSQNRLQAHVLS